MSVLHRLKRSGDIENLRSVELTELFRARDASCPKGKKMEIEVNLTNRNLWRIKLMNNKRIIIGVTIGITAAILWSVVFINVLNSMAGIGIGICLVDQIINNWLHFTKRLLMKFHQAYTSNDRLPDQHLLHQNIYKFCPQVPALC